MDSLSISPTTETNLPQNDHMPMISSIWDRPATIEINNFKYKSLSNFSFNTAVGCGHGCRFCYVPETSVNKFKAVLSPLGVNDPDADWGRYVFPRRWNEKKFLRSLAAAEAIHRTDLKPDGHRAVMFSTTTDPYQVIYHPNAETRRELNLAHRYLVRRALELIRDHSTLNVRILTRSALAEKDFNVMKSLEDRLLFGMSLPTLNNRLANIYEPNAPAPTRRLKTLQAAKAAGLHVYAAVAPTYPECDEDDLRTTIRAVAALDPVTVFHEPINIRAENVERIRLHAESTGVATNTDVFASTEAWRQYAIGQMQMVEGLAAELGVADRLHLWPDASLITNVALSSYEDPSRMFCWIKRWHGRVSEWPVAVEPVPAVLSTNA